VLFIISLKRCGLYILRALTAHQTPARK